MGSFSAAQDLQRSGTRCPRITRGELFRCQPSLVCIFCVSTCILSGSSWVLCLLAPYPEVSYSHIHLPSPLKLTLVMEGGLCLALEHQPAGSLRAVPGSCSSLGPRLLEQSKKKKGKQQPKKCIPLCVGSKNAEDSSNSGSFQTTAAEKTTSISSLKLHKQHYEFNRLGV